MILCFYVTHYRRLGAAVNSVCTATLRRNLRLNLYVSMLLCFYSLMKHSSCPHHARIRRIRVQPQTTPQLHALSRWVTLRQGRAILHVAGRPAAMLVTYAEYHRLEKLHTAQHKATLLACVTKLQARRGGAAPTHNHPSAHPIPSSKR
jgi:hypothetical protein